MSAKESRDPAASPSGGGQEEWPELAKELASMVTHYVEGGLKLGTNWRNGLDKIIECRLNRIATLHPRAAMKSQKLEAWTDEHGNESVGKPK